MPEEYSHLSTHTQITKPRWDRRNDLPVVSWLGYGGAVPRIHLSNCSCSRHPIAAGRATCPATTNKCLMGFELQVPPSVFSTRCWRRLPLPLVVSRTASSSECRYIRGTSSVTNCLGCLWLKDRSAHSPYSVRPVGLNLGCTISSWLKILKLKAYSRPTASDSGVEV